MREFDAVATKAFVIRKIIKPIVFVPNYGDR